MLSLRRGRDAARFAETESDLRRAQHLRHLAFRARRGLGAEDETSLDADEFDGDCRHVLVEETASGTLVCCFRLLPLLGGAEVGRSYSAQYYDLEKLRDFKGKMVETGRFCIHPDWHDPDILRVAWGAMTRYVDEEGVEMLFGCSSFAGVQAEGYRDAFALLRV